MYVKKSHPANLTFCSYEHMGCLSNGQECFLNF